MNQQLKLTTEEDPSFCLNPSSVTRSGIGIYHTIASTSVQ